METSGVPQTPGANASEAVSLPGVFLIITGAIGVLLAVINFAQLAFNTQNGLPPELLNDPNMAQFAPILERAQSFGWVGPLFTLGTGGFVIFGGLKMRALQSWGLALAAAIVAMVPCFGPCCCVGLPVGIWALVVLNKPDVKGAFAG